MIRQEAGRGHSRSVSPSAISAASAGLLTCPPIPGSVAVGAAAACTTSTPSCCPRSPPTAPAPAGRLAASPGGSTVVVSASPRGPARDVADPAASVSRETAADTARLTRTGGTSTGCRAGCELSLRTVSCLATGWSTCELSAAPCSGSAPGPGRAARPPLPRSPLPRCGQPTPMVSSCDSFLADAREDGRNSAGHPTPFGEGITALLFCFKPLRATGTPAHRHRSGCCQPDDCRSRIDLTLPGEQNVGLPHTQRSQHLSGSCQFLLSLCSLDREHDPAGAEQPDREPRQPVQRRHGPGRHHVRGEPSGEVLRPATQNPRVRQPE